MLHCREAAKIQVNLQNLAKFTETHKVPQNLPEILSNTCNFSQATIINCCCECCFVLLMFSFGFLSGPFKRKMSERPN